MSQRRSAHPKYVSLRRTKSKSDVSSSVGNDRSSSRAQKKVGSKALPEKRGKETDSLFVPESGDGGGCRDGGLAYEL